MNISRLILWLCLLVGLCAIWGWQAAYVAPTDMLAEDDEWPHSQLHQKSTNTNIHGIIMTSIQQANILPIPKNGSLSDGEHLFLSASSEPKDHDGLPELPVIISVSIIDDRPRLHVNDVDNGIIHMQEGEIHPSGWMLEVINLQEAVFGYEDETRLLVISVSGNENDIKSSTLNHE